VTESADTAPPRVLMVTGAYYPEISSGGVQCRNMARQLATRARVRVLTTAVDPALPAEDVVDGVPVTRVAVDVKRALSKMFAGVRMVARVTQLVRQSDVVHLHGCSTKNIIVTLIAKWLRRPVVLSLHTAGYDEPAVVEQQGSLALWAFMSADRYMSVSPALVDSYLAFGMPADKMRLVPNGIDTSVFTPALDKTGVRTALGLPVERPIVMFVGFFSVDKQPQVLFDAWLTLQTAGVDTTLVFVGATTSPYFEVDEGLAGRMRTEAGARGMQDRLIFTGETHVVASFLQAADVFVLPSKREGLPVALLEAMACALPCIASRLPGSTDTIIRDHENGLLIDAGNVTAFAAAIALVLNQPRLAAQLGAAARATIESRFRSDAVAERWLESYALGGSYSPAAR
jgi:glycosyltransferase involved in cell wall biosynthesis